MDELETKLRGLIEQWDAMHVEAETRARAEATGDVARSYYFQGVAKTLEKMVGDLRELVDTPATPQAEAAQPMTYIVVSESEVSKLLVAAGVFPRTLRAHPDYAFTAIFPRLQPMSQEQRVSLITQADPRIIILDQGRLPDSGEPYIDFAFNHADSGV
jgi:hypothetical protein